MRTVTESVKLQGSICEFRGTQVSSGKQAGPSRELGSRGAAGKVGVGGCVRKGPQGTDAWEDTLEREKQERQGEATLQFLPWEEKQEMGDNVAQTLGTCKTKQHHPPRLPESLPLSYHLQ